MPFPDIQNTNFEREPEKLKELLDYAVMQWESRKERRLRMDAMYNAYNGITNEKEIESIIKTTGKKSKTKYVRYRLGRSKIKQLHGEFLEIPINAQVTSVNRDAQNEKMNKYKEMLGMSLAKPFIEKARAEGYNVFDGVKIPDKDDPNFWNANNFKLTNEIIMGTIISDKLKNQRLKNEFYNNFVDLTLTAEAFGKNERNIDGEDVYRYIPAKYAMYEESVYDPFLKRTPYMGEVRYMYYHEILTNKEFDLDATQKKDLKALRESYSKEVNQGSVEIVNGHPAFAVYKVEFKIVEPVRRIISEAKNSSVPHIKTLSEDYYKKNKKKIDLDVKKGKYKLEVYYRESLMSAIRIGTSIYTKAKKEENLIQILNKNNKYQVDFNYSGMLFSTVNGTRVSLQEVIYELEKIYDDIRFMINKEIRKIRGDSLIYDDAFLPKNKLFIDVLDELSEDGVVRYNSAQEGNKGGLDSDSNKVGIGALNLGQSNTLITLINQAMDIERVMDRITGMNESRQGLEKATATATTNNNNVEASRSMTYDMFYFIQQYIEQVLMKLAEKTKLNYTHDGEDSRMFVLSDSEMQYLVATKNLMQHNYAVSVNNGRREQMILNKMEQLFPQEINAGQISSGDISKFYISEDFGRALQVLDKARERMEGVRQKEIKMGNEAKENETQSKLKIAQDDREDKQAHEKELKLIEIEGNKEVELLKGSLKAGIDNQNNISKAGIEKAKTKEIPQL